MCFIRPYVFVPLILEEIKRIFEFPPGEFPFDGPILILSSIISPMLTRRIYNTHNGLLELQWIIETTAPLLSQSQPAVARAILLLYSRVFMLIPIVSFEELKERREKKLPKNSSVFFEDEFNSQCDNLPYDPAPSGQGETFGFSLMSFYTFYLEFVKEFFRKYMEELNEFDPGFQDTYTIGKILVYLSSPNIREELWSIVWKEFSSKINMRARNHLPILHAFGQIEQGKYFNRILDFVEGKLIQKHKHSPEAPLLFLFEHGSLKDSNAIEYSIEDLSEETITYYMDVLSHSIEPNKLSDEQLKRLQILVAACLNHKKMKVFNLGYDFIRCFFSDVASCTGIEETFKTDPQTCVFFFGFIGDTEHLKRENDKDQETKTSQMELEKGKENNVQDVQVGHKEEDPSMPGPEASQAETGEKKEAMIEEKKEVVEAQKKTAVLFEENPKSVIESECFCLKTTRLKQVLLVLRTFGMSCLSFLKELAKAETEMSEKELLPEIYNDMLKYELFADYSQEENKLQLEANKLTRVMTMLREFVSMSKKFISLPVVSADESELTLVKELRNEIKEFLEEKLEFEVPLLRYLIKTNLFTRIKIVHEAANLFFTDYNPDSSAESLKKLVKGFPRNPYVREYYIPSAILSKILGQIRHHQARFVISQSRKFPISPEKAMLMLFLASYYSTTISGAGARSFNDRVSFFVKCLERKYSTSFIEKMVLDFFNPTLESFQKQFSSVFAEKGKMDPKVIDKVTRFSVNFWGKMSALVEKRKLLPKFIDFLETASYYVPSNQMSMFMSRAIMIVQAIGEIPKKNSEDSGSSLKRAYEKYFLKAPNALKELMETQTKPNEQAQSSAEAHQELMAYCVRKTQELCQNANDPRINLRIFFGFPLVASWSSLSPEIQEAVGKIMRDHFIYSANLSLRVLGRAFLMRFLCGLATNRRTKVKRPVDFWDGMKLEELFARRFTRTVDERELSSSKKGIIMPQLEVKLRPICDNQVVNDEKEPIFTRFIEMFELFASDTALQIESSAERSQMSSGFSDLFLLTHWYIFSSLRRGGSDTTGIKRQNLHLWKKMFQIYGSPLFKATRKILDDFKGNKESKEYQIKAVYYTMALFRGSRYYPLAEREEIHSFLKKHVLEGVELGGNSSLMLWKEGIYFSAKGFIRDFMDIFEGEIIRKLREYESTNELVYTKILKFYQSNMRYVPILSEQARQFIIESSSRKQFVSMECVRLPIFLLKLVVLETQASIIGSIFGKMNGTSQHQEVNLLWFKQRGETQYQQLMDEAKSNPKFTIFNDLFIYYQPETQTKTINELVKKYNEETDTNIKHQILTFFSRIIPEYLTHDLLVSTFKPIYELTLFFQVLLPFIQFAPTVLILHSISKREMNLSLLLN